MEMFPEIYLDVSSIPEAGKVENVMFNQYRYFRAPTAGIENVFGQKFDQDSEEWYIWFWETDSENNWKWK